MRTAVRAGALAAFVLSFLTATPPAIAGPSDDVITPIVEEGEREIDFKAGSAEESDCPTPHASRSARLARRCFSG